VGTIAGLLVLSCTARWHTPNAYRLGVAAAGDCVPPMVIGRPRAGWPVLVALLIGVLAALPAVTHCLHGPSQHGSSITSAAATQVGANGGALTHRRADNARHAALCHSVDVLVATVRADPGLGLLAAVVAAMASHDGAPLRNRVGRGSPVRSAAISRSGRVLLADLCIIRR
jgi:hypothetical protein